MTILDQLEKRGRWLAYFSICLFAFSFVLWALVASLLTKKTDTFDSIVCHSITLTDGYGTVLATLNCETADGQPTLSLGEANGDQRFVVLSPSAISFGARGEKAQAVVGLARPYEAGRPVGFVRLKDAADHAIIFDPSKAILGEDGMFHKLKKPAR